MAATEWEMQEKITHHWITNGAAINGKKLFLVAWEVMVDSWGINDSKGHWNEPSIDFFFLDQMGQVWLMEMKRYVKSPRDVWEALCQVTHRAVALMKTYSFEKLESAFSAAYSGQHGRVKSSSETISLLDSHKAFFNLGNPLSINSIGKNPFRRVVAAIEFGSSWEDVRQRFASEDLNTLQEYIRSRYVISNNAREFSRFMKLKSSEFSILAMHPPMSHCIDGHLAG
jgi:hypothetical protein